ncbi:TPA: hypothetical protein EYP13_02500 [Candidatus Micrarchaeota archaeon]|nr:hypothetical protein [Candidatus Micrarchaeota archaeon]
MREAMAARAKTESGDSHLVRPESRSLLAALYVLQRRKGVDAPLYLHTADKRKKIFWFCVPDEKIHTYNGGRGVLHFGSCPHPLTELTHTKKPVVVARKAVLDV